MQTGASSSPGSFAHEQGLGKAGTDRSTSFAGVACQWELYWDRLLSVAQIRESGKTFILVNAPDKWSHYKIGGVSLSEKGKATYHVRVTGARAGEVYGVRIKDMRNVYRLYIDGVLVAQNGSFDDDSSAPASAYRPQLASFTPTAEQLEFPVTKIFPIKTVLGEGGAATALISDEAVTEAVETGNAIILEAVMPENANSLTVTFEQETLERMIKAETQSVDWPVWTPGTIPRTALRMSRPTAPSVPISNGRT